MAKPKKVIASTRPAPMVHVTKNNPAPASAEPNRKKPNSAHTRLVKGSCRIVRAMAFMRRVWSSVMASDNSRPRMRTRTLLSSLEPGLMRPAG
jgi:hypothetical protein